jgi:two-component system response regulator AtoC
MKGATQGERVAAAGPPPPGAPSGSSEGQSVAERILIVDDDEALRESLGIFLTTEGFEVATACDGDSALARIGDQAFDLVLCDVRMPGTDGMELLPELVRRVPGLTVLMMSAFGGADLAIEAMNRGAYDYLAKPFQPSEVSLAIRKALERERLRRTNATLQRDMHRELGRRPIVASSAPMIEVLEILERAAGFKATVLVTGESGTGKEVMARAIHAQSPRCERDFVAVNCGAIPENLLESELFGHARGAFTGADRARPGLFAEADGGTLFLDEIGELPPSLQVKLLRVLQEEEIRPVGQNKPRAVDVRVIAATSRDLEAEVRERNFREDLFYRLDVVRLHVPPLRERGADVTLLVNHFVEHFGRTLGRPGLSISDEALEKLNRYPWPGNVRELENVIERATILSQEDRILPRDLPPSVGNSVPQASAQGAGGDFSLRRARRRFEAEWIRGALEACDGNRTHAAKRLEISHRALLYKIKEYGLGRDGGKNS